MRAPSEQWVARMHTSSEVWRYLHMNTFDTKPAHFAYTSWCARQMSSSPLTWLNSLATLPPKSQPESAGNYGIITQPGMLSVAPRNVCV